MKSRLLFHSSMTHIGTVVEFLQSLLKSATDATSEGAAYGGGMSGAPFEPLAFIKKPQVILRIISIVFAFFVFGSIITVNDQDMGRCPINGDPGACTYGTTIGVLAFLICVFFLVIDARFDNFSNINTRKRAVVIDMGLSGVFAFIWFVTFCYLTDAWRKTDDSVKAIVGVSYINTAIAFSFFSIITWGFICLLNFLRYRQGISTIFSGEYEEQFAEPNQQPPPANQMNNETFTLRQVPFNPINNPNSGYQQPTY